MQFKSRYKHHNNFTLNLDKTIKLLSKIIKDKKYKKEESFVYTPFDKKNLITTVFALKKLKIAKTKLIIVVGIGGSSLGIKTVYNALKKDNTAEVFFLENLSKNTLLKLEKKINNKFVYDNEITVFLISKSGETLETQTNYSWLIQKWPFLKKRTCIITQKYSLLDSFGKTNKLPTIYIPDKIGGRFSIFTAVGLAPLITARINIIRFLIGAQKELTKILDNKGEPVLQYTNNLKQDVIKRKKNIKVLFIFNERLKYFGKWYSQLLAESLGKNGKGITPIYAIGTTDLHSLGQLFVGGPKDKIFEFIIIEEKSKYYIKQSPLGKKVKNLLNNKSITEIKKAIYESVLKDYKKNKIYYSQIVLKGESLEEDLGRLMMFKMIEIYFLGKILKINPFGQPNVESYKKSSKKLLKSL